MDIKPTDKKDKLIIFFDEIKSGSVESAVKDLCKINIDDRKYVQKNREWAEKNGLTIESVRLDPIQFHFSTSGGSCYDGLSLYDAIQSSFVPVEITCYGRIMSMGIVVLLASNVRKAHKNTTFLIHQAMGLALGSLSEMKASVEEVSRINDILFDIITSRTKVTKERLNEVLEYKQNWIFTAQEALELGIITEII